VLQSKLGSFIEAWANVAVGFGINYTANLLVLPAFGFTSLTWQTNIIIGLVYTVISVIRSYVLRRWFNDQLRRAAERLARRIEK
jgi:hypothetical protein